MTARRLRELAWQGAVLAVVCALVVLAGRQARENLAARGIAQGFGYLGRPAGFEIAPGLLPYSSRDTYARALAVGVVNTLRVSALAMTIATVLGVGIAVARLSRHRAVAMVAGAVVEAIRNTPLLVQVFTLFFVLPTLGITLSPFVVGCIALVAWGGAYNVENFRAGLGAVAHRYLEGAWALGFSRTRTFLSITVPIGARLSLPGLTNTMISILKNSALMLGIGLAELTFTVQKLSAETFRTVELFVVLGIVYLALVLVLSSVMHLIGRRYALGAGV